MAGYAPDMRLSFDNRRLPVKRDPSHILGPDAELVCIHIVDQSTFVMSNTYRSWKSKTAAGLLLAGCLVSAPAFSQEIIKWVDEDGVTHFGHAATAARQAVKEHMQDKTGKPADTMVAADTSRETVVVATTALAANSTRSVSAGGSD